MIALISLVRLCLGPAEEIQPRLLINYSITFGLALFIGTKVPYISLSYVTSGAILPVAAVFIVLVVAEILRNNISMKSKLTLAIASLVIIVGGFVALAVTGLLGGISRKIHHSFRPIH